MDRMMLWIGMISLSAILGAVLALAWNDLWNCELWPVRRMVRRWLERREARKG
jgi:hypothetical protein